MKSFKMTTKQKDKKNYGFTLATQNQRTFELLVASTVNSAIKTTPSKKQQTPGRSRSDGGGPRSATWIQNATSLHSLLKLPN
jgi:hypothetical protein